MRDRVLPYRRCHFGMLISDMTEPHTQVGRQEFTASAVGGTHASDAGLS